MAKKIDFNYIFKFTWVIEDFPQCPYWMKQSIYSPVYAVQNMDRSQWFIALYPRLSDEFMVGDLCRSASNSAAEFIEVDFKIEIEDSKNKILFSHNDKHNFLKDSCKKFDICISFADVFNNKSSVKDSLTIRCFMTSEAYKNAKSDECFARTKISYERTCFKWTSCGLDFATSSDCIKFYYHKQQPMFEMKIETRAFEDYFTISILKLSDFEDFGALICQFMVLNTSEADEISKRGFERFKMCTRWEFPKFLKKSILKKKKLIDPTNGNFELLCDFYIQKKEYFSHIDYYKSDAQKVDQLLFNEAERINRDSNQRVSNAVEQINNSDISAEKYHTGALIEDLSAMLNNNTETDAILKIGEKEFPAHKCVLSTRSPVFKVMFEQDMSEKKSGLVQIQDLDSETLKAFLEYLYTGAIMNINADLAHKLLLAAEKYQVVSLKKLCVDHLIPALTIKTVCECLLAADMVNEQTLKSAAINYLKDHVAEVVSSKDWFDLVKRNFVLSVEVIRIVHS